MQTLLAPTSTPSPETMNGKEVLHRDAKTVLSFGSSFQEKLLCDGITLNPGDACAFCCAYCYVPPQVFKFIHSTLEGRLHVDVVVRRRNAITLLVNQLLNAKGEP